MKIPYKKSHHTNFQIVLIKIIIKWNLSQEYKNVQRQEFEQLYGLWYKNHVIISLDAEYVL